MINKTLDNQTEYDLFHQNLSSILLGSSIMALFSFFVYAFLDFNPSNLSLSLLECIVSLALFLMHKKGVSSRVIKNLFLTFLNIFLLPIAFFTTNGSKGPILYYSSLFILVSALLANNKREFTIPGLAAFIMIILQVFEHNFETQIAYFSFSYNTKDQLIMHYALMVTIFCYIVFLHKNNELTMRSKLIEMSMIDELTGLYNRRYLFKILDYFHEAALRLNQKYVLIMIDIDNFKQINDTYGHQIGDEVLIELGKIIQDNLRKYDIAARYGGDEFSIILPEINLPEAELVISRIETTFSIYAQKYNNVRLGLSFGYSNDISLNVDGLMKKADDALYVNKSFKRK